MKKIVYFAIGRSIPKVGEQYVCARIEYLLNALILRWVATRPIEEIRQIPTRFGQERYFLLTQDAVYLVEVNPQG